MIFLLLPRLSSHVMPTWAYSILREQDRDTKQKTNRIQRLPYLKGTHTIGFLPAKLQLFRESARGWNKKPSVPQEFGLCSIMRHMNNRHTSAPSEMGV